MTQCAGVLTDEKIRAVWGSTVEPCVVKQGNEYLIHKFGRAIERAVLDRMTANTPPKLKVEVRSFPESNGKRNWTALLLREEPWDGLAGNCGGITIAQGELWNRVAYAAERTKFLLGLRDTEPWILDYGLNVETPEQWKGEGAACK